MFFFFYPYAFIYVGLRRALRGLVKTEPLTLSPPPSRTLRAVVNFLSPSAMHLATTPSTMRTDEEKQAGVKRCLPQHLRAGSDSICFRSQYRSRDRRRRRRRTRFNRPREFDWRGRLQVLPWRLIFSPAFHAVDRLIDSFISARVHVLRKHATSRNDFNDSPAVASDGILFHFFFSNFFLFFYFSFPALSRYLNSTR